MSATSDKPYTAKLYRNIRNGEAAGRFLVTTITAKTAPARKRMVRAFISTYYDPDNVTVEYHDPAY